MLLKLQEDRISQASSSQIHQQPIYITEDFTVTESEDRPRTELRGHLKRIQKQRLLADGDFVCLAHLAKQDGVSAIQDLLGRIRQCRSDLDRISIFSKRFQKCRSQLADKLAIEGVVQVDQILNRCSKTWLRSN